MTESSKATVTRHTKRPIVETDWSDIEALRLEVLELRDELIGAEAKLGQLKAELLRTAGKGRLKLQANGIENHSHILHENQALKLQIKDMTGSTTWKIARLIIRPLSIFRKQTNAPINSETSND